jgi:hypothetical protein
MIYSEIEYKSIQIYGQEWRDQKRLQSLTKLGYEVFSFDDKHGAIPGKHCNGNFNDPRKMNISIKKQASYPTSLGAKYILLDYFFSPVIISIIFFIKIFSYIIGKLVRL